ncbi:MAG: DNA polymerase [Candidatus Nomurabacteria bacterium]|nr:DNA polymerase [Candidatus Nomurabacteria bacterium]
MVTKKTDKKRLILLDTHAIIHRAYHALPEFMNSRGEPTGAIYGLATMLFKIITELKPDYIIACYDLPKKTFRHIAYDDYKAGRAKADDALVAQLIRSREFFEALSIPMYECEGFEADDLLGTIVEKNLKNKDLDIVIASGDMDTLQLVSGSQVQVYTLKKGINDTILYNEEKVKERFGFDPEYLPDYKGLRGDPSDNIIGIKGIGEKTATILISKYGSIEKMYKDIKKNGEAFKDIGINDRVLALLKEGEDEAIFSKTLATIRRDAPINFKLPSKIWKEEVFPEKAAEFFKKMEFKSLQDRFLRILNPLLVEEGAGGGDKLINHHLALKGTPPQKGGENTEKAKIAFWLLDSEKTNPDINEVIEYKNSSSLDDALEKMEEDIKKEGLEYVYKDIELPIIPIISKMEKVGIKIDTNYLKKLSEEYHSELSKIEKEIWGYSGREFNINSPKQLGEILFDEIKIGEVDGKSLGIKMKKTSGGARSTKESELEKLRDLHPIINKILEHRELQKLLSTYIDTISKMISNDGRLHASFLQYGTTTGRFSSNNPNLQNIPTKTERGKKIRDAFIAESGYALASFDYSQIELRIAALLSQDSFFIKTFQEGRDIHSAVAMKVFGVPVNDVTLDMRRRAKVINFGILYGMGVTALSQNLNTNRKEAQIFYDNYFKQFPTIADYLESIKIFARKNGYTKTLFGRKRYFPAINSSLPFMKAMAERMATNAPIQGTATADIIKIGMKKVEEELKNAGILSEVRMVLQVHDELVYEIKKDKLEIASKIIKKGMIDVIPDQFLVGMVPVPLDVTVGFGKNWGELK